MKFNVIQPQMVRSMPKTGKLAMGVAAALTALTLATSCTGKSQEEKFIESSNKFIENLENYNNGMIGYAQPKLDSLKADVLRSQIAALEYSRFDVAGAYMDALIKSGNPYNVE